MNKEYPAQLRWRMHGIPALRQAHVSMRSVRHKIVGDCTNHIGPVEIVNSHVETPSIKCRL
jgi:hypothetical protein